MVSSKACKEQQKQQHGVKTNRSFHFIFFFLEASPSPNTDQTQKTIKSI
jgi:hypothetical protein